MRRILEDSPVTGYQLFRFQGKRADGTPVTYAKYYIRHGSKTVCAKTADLSQAKIEVKKLAGKDTEGHKRLTAAPVEVRVGTLLDLVIEDYRQSGQKDRR
jgi:hypothetical protein